MLFFLKFPQLLLTFKLSRTSLQAVRTKLSSLHLKHQLLLKSSHRAGEANSRALLASLARRSTKRRRLAHVSLHRQPQLVPQPVLVLPQQERLLQA